MPTPVAVLSRVTLFRFSVVYPWKSTIGAPRKSVLGCCIFCTLLTIVRSLIFKVSIVSSASITYIAHAAVLDVSVCPLPLIVNDLSLMNIQTPPSPSSP